MNSLNYKKFVYNNTIYYLYIGNDQNYPYIDESYPDLINLDCKYDFRKYLMKIENDDLVEVTNPIEKYNFLVNVLKYENEKLIEISNNKFKEKMFFYDIYEELKSIIGLESSLDDVVEYFHSDLDKRNSIYNNNLILVGKGKRFILETISEKANLPLVYFSDYSNIEECVKELISKSGNNIYEALTGYIVLTEEEFDSFKDKYIELKYGDLTYKFDLSKIRYILVGRDNIIKKGFNKRIVLEEVNTRNEQLYIVKGILDKYRKLYKRNNKKLVFERDLELKIVNKYHEKEDLFSFVDESIKNILTNNKKDNFRIEFSMIEKEIDKMGELVRLEDVNKLNNQNKLSVDLEELRKDFQERLVYLQGYVKGQDNVLKELLFNILYNDLVQNSNLDMKSKSQRIKHILLQGAPGTGKTFITTLIAETFKDKPYAVIDATEYTEAGYYGKSPTDMLLHLYHAAGNNIEKAQKGILIIDEFDKKADSAGSKDTTRGAVQNSLLKILEGTKLTLEVKDGMGTKNIFFDTSELTIICCGAFDGLDEIRKRRINAKTEVKKSLGFGAQASMDKEREKRKENINTDYTVDDYEKFGIHKQLLRRLKIHRSLNKLTKEDFKDIMLHSKSSPFLVKIALLELSGIKVKWTEGFIDKIVDKTYKMGFGVSSIGIIFSDIYKVVAQEIMFDDYDSVLFDEECVDNPNLVKFIKNKEKVK